MIFFIFENLVYNDLDIFIIKFDISTILIFVELLNLANGRYLHDKDFYVRLLSILQNENCNLLKRIGSHFKLYFVLKTSHYVWDIIFAYYISLFKLHFKT